MVHIKEYLSNLYSKSYVNLSKSYSKLLWMDLGYIHC